MALQPIKYIGSSERVIAGVKLGCAGLMSIGQVCFLLHEINMCSVGNKPCVCGISILHVTAQSDH